MTDDQVAYGGQTITGAQLDALFERAEGGDVLAGQPGPIHVGRPPSIGDGTAEVVTVRLDSDRIRRLDAQAEATRQSRSAIIRRALDRELAPA